MAITGTTVGQEPTSTNKTEELIFVQRPTKKENLPLLGKHILIIIENLPAPFDRRVWQEANSLKSHGAQISIICPKLKGYNKSFERINDIDIYRHPLPVEGEGPWGYLKEYSSAIFWEMVLATKIFLKKRFHVIHGCNPPDLIFLTALPFKFLFKVKYIFDHHDINPELYIAKYNKKGLFYKLMLLLEKWTFNVADYSIATNASYKEIAISRGAMKEERVRVVRSGPKLSKLKIIPVSNELKKGKRFLVGYLGIIGQQEGLDLLMNTIKIIKSLRDDVGFAIIGEGTHLKEIKKLAEDLEINSMVEFYGRVDDITMLKVLNSCDVCVNPDTPNEMNNLSTMNKIMEYMALKKPIVQFDLKEGRFSAQKASLYVKHKDTLDFALKIIQLLDDDKLRKEMGEYGYKRVKEELSWEIEETKLVDFYKKVFGIN